MNKDVFNQNLMQTKDNEILLKLQELHDRTSNIHEQKYSYVSHTYYSLLMFPNDCKRYVFKFELTSHKLYKF
jgi:hypothetical protein